MQFTDISRAHRIGASCQVVEIGPFRLMIDSGLDPKTIGLEAAPNFDLVEDGTVDAIILTHCHLDHLGSLPMAHRRHPQAQVLTSRASAQIAPRMLRNSVNVMKRQAQEQAVREYPLYGFAEISQLEEAFTPLSWEKSYLLHKGDQSLSITLYRAGHIVGAASVLVEYQRRRIFFTADISFDANLTLAGATPPEGRIDTLVMETTRGASPQEEGYSREKEVRALLATIDSTLERGGSVLIPSFALGRMQEILAIIHHGRQKGLLRPCPVFCSGLGLDLVDYFDAITRKTGDVHFSRKLLKAIDVRSPSQNFIAGTNPPERGIYVLSSGMIVEHTPSYMAAAAMLEHSQNAVCFVGYCDPDTPGGELLRATEGQKILFNVLDYSATVRASIHRFDLSGHADRNALLDLALRLDPRTIVLSHGDPQARAWFETELLDYAPAKPVLDPEPGVAYQI